MDHETKTEASTEIVDVATPESPVVDVAPPEGEENLSGRRKAALREAQDDVPHVAVARSEPARLERAREHAILCARIAEDNRAKDILLLDLRQATPLLDFFVIASANSRRGANAIAIEIDMEMKRLGERKLGMEGAEEGRWILIDYGDFVVHIFSEDARTYYSLEEIWGDAPHVEWRDPARLAATQGSD
ncbi:MAG: ribosome silencing factor [Isosphaeraceae bacterium]|nr:ribosome silencing factor [Isosphaeraceae bacterium]